MGAMTLPAPLTTLPNDDGFTDFLVGSPYSSEEAVAAGKSYLIFWREKEGAKP